MPQQLIVTAGHAKPAVCPLQPNQTVVLGRHRSSGIVLRDQHASRQHAEVFHKDGSWFIRDCKTMNGTRVNGELVKDVTLLLPGHEIRIGETRLRFEAPLAGERVNGTIHASASAPSPVAHVLDSPSGAGDTVLQLDELGALCGFMAAAVEETSGQVLIRRALDALLVHGRASLVGFLSLDPEAPFPRLVLPERANVDANLSKQLTRRALRNGQAVWLGAHPDDLDPSDSLASYTDAICVPLRTNGQPLGALHAYRTCGGFREREFHFCEALAGYLAASLRAVRQRRSLAAENSRLRSRLPLPSKSADDEAIVGSGEAMEQLRQKIARIGPAPCTVLITGETGVGKELVANALHRASSRRDAPLVAVNCAAIPASVAEGELFGHRKGGFTHAVEDRPGFFEQADEGTIFLDEIGDMPLDLQAKLLRVLEGRGLRPVGGTADVFVDVRVIAATHCDLEQLVKEGKFREDLFYRLGGVLIQVPPLRERRQDIPELAGYFLQRFSQKYGRPLRLSAAALDCLQACSWPGNVRQLFYVLEGAVASSGVEEVEVCHLRLPSERQAPSAPEDCPPTLNLEELEIWAIQKALKQAGGVAQAAELLGIHRGTLTLKIKKYHLDRAQS